MKQRWALLLMLTALAAGHAAPSAKLVCETPWVSHALAVVGEPVEVTTMVRNTGPGDLSDITVNLFLPEGWSSDPVVIRLPKLAPYTTTKLRFRLMAETATHGAGRLSFAGKCLGRPLDMCFPLSSCQPLDTILAKFALRERSMGEVPNDGTIYVSTGSYLVFLPQCGEGRGPGVVYAKQGYQWERVATFPALGRVVYVDGGKRGRHVAERWLFPSKVWIPRDPACNYLLTLKDTWRDDCGRQWMAKAWLGPTEDPRVVKYSNVVWCNQPMTLLRLEGPMLNVGDGTFGTQHAALLPPSGADTRADGAVLARSQVKDDGVMAVQRPGGGVIGLLWDPRQYAMPQLSPAALFASPNVLFNRNNTYLSLIAPPLVSTQRCDCDYTTRPWQVCGRQPVYLRSELYVAPDGGLDGVRQAWQKRYGPGSGYQTRDAYGLTDDPQP